VEPLEAICPYSFRAPLAPAVAARLEGKDISLQRIAGAVRALAARHTAVLVEGAGGLLVPLAARETYADLAALLRFPALVVARAGLGTVNHTALTCEALDRRGVTVAGIVLNRLVPGDDPSVPHNAAEIERLTGVPVLTTLPHEADIAARAARLQILLAGKVQF
jgi:dethiobiotin synthetase